MTLSDNFTIMSNGEQSDQVKETSSWYISDETMDYLYISLTITVHGLVSVAGVVTNCVNVIIFFKLGLKDSMSTGLFALSLTDFAVTLMQLASCCSYLVKIVYPESPVDPWLFGAYVFSWSRYVAYLISCWITTVISLERCFCVVSPFTVRQKFTKARCLMIILGISIFHVCVHLPIFIFANIQWVSISPGTTVARNGTMSEKYVLTVLYSDSAAEWEILSDMIAGISLSVLSQVILLICTVWMIYSLKASSKIRQHMDPVRYQNKPRSTLQENKGGASSDDAGALLSAKERRMAKVVLFMAIILSACNVPRFLAIALHHILPGMKMGVNKNLDTVFWEVSYTFCTICCTTNFLVYFKLNSKYRSEFLHMFQWSNKETDKGLI
uniref:G-protein coupled receptors family 1 profile domain-containing protein n=1 Tax=Biomphalaria glabrata TaxID=6526 RepID=A0A2C9M748_BIOGL